MKKVRRPGEMLSFAGAMVEEQHLSIRQVCQLVNVLRSNFSYVAGADKNVPVREQLQDLKSGIAVCINFNKYLLFTDNPAFKFH